MKIYVICSSNDEQCIKDTKRFFDSEDADIIDDINKVKSYKDFIVVSHSVVPLTKKIDWSDYNNLYIYHSGHIVHTKDESMLLEMRDEAIKSKNWQRAKGINDLLIDISFINKERILCSMPDYLQIETTSICNAKCIMCSHYFSENTDATNLSDLTINNMVDALEISRTISLNGMGEPFISPKLPDQIDFYASRGNRIVTNTNLSVLTDRLIDQINKHFEWIEVSCDGATKETYEAIRKNLRFDTFLSNLRTLKERCPSVRKHIATVIMRQNVHEMPLLVKLASEFGASIITFMTLNSNIIIQNQNDEMSNYPKVLEYYSVKAIEAGEKLGIPVIVPNMSRLDRSISYESIKVELEQMHQVPFFKNEVELKKMKETALAVSDYLNTHDEIQRDTQASDVKCSGICDWLLKQSYIDLNGNVAMCCRNQSFHFGNINESGNFSEVWNSPFYQKVRDIFYSGYVPESCLRCGLIESGNLKFLSVDIDESFYRDPKYKVRQKGTLKELLERINGQ